MIRAYHRPETLEEALRLLARAGPRTLPMGGGTVLTQPDPQPVEVVDLQALGLNAIRSKGNELEIGATATLQAVLDSGYASPAFIDAIRREAPLNIRNMATVAGTIVAGDGRSPFVNSLLAMDARVTLEHPGDAGNGRTSNSREVGEIVAFRENALRGKLISRVTVATNIKFAYQVVAKTPADKPIVSAALAQWPSGRTRLVIGGFGAAPSLAMDGTEPAGVAAAARNACHDATDEWASAGYRMHAAEKLALRCLELAA